MVARSIRIKPRVFGRIKDFRPLLLCDSFSSDFFVLRRHIYAFKWFVASFAISIILFGSVETYALQIFGMGILSDRRRLCACIQIATG
jgi:hypothetical protein